MAGEVRLIKDLQVTGCCIDLLSWNETDMSIGYKPTQSIGVQMMRQHAPSQGGCAPFDFVRGDGGGLQIPAHGDALREAGPEFLTTAFRSYGSIAHDNRVVRVMEARDCAGGSTGHKLFLRLEYERPEPGLHEDLFVKFSRDFTDTVRDERGKHEMESEVRFAAISKRPGFPINVPKPYFADYQNKTHTGLLITQSIPFGTKGLESHHPKCLDNEIADPLEHYQAIIQALARIAAAHRSGKLSPSIDTEFPYDRTAAERAVGLHATSAQLRVKIGAFADFAARAPQLFPARLADPAFFSGMASQMDTFCDQAETITRFLQSDNDIIALCHWNANIDNGWYWRDAAGRLQCGLMDWGHVGQMNVAFSLWGCLSGAGLGIWNDHLHDLLELFRDELSANGGPFIRIETLELHLLLYAMMMGLAYFIDSPSRIIARYPDAIHADGPFDPVFRSQDTARNQLHISTNFLNLWSRYDLGEVLRRMHLARGAPRK